jgi:hypothetical protein
MLGQPLMQTPEAIDFFAQPNVMRKLSLGDPEKLNGGTYGNAYNAVVNAHNAIGDGMTKVAALADDKTRTEVMRHAAAKTIAERTVVALQDTKANLEANAKRMNREATEAIEQRFAADPNRASIQSEIRGWIREQAKSPEGLAKIREAMKADAEVGAVLYHSPHFLLNLAPSVRDSMTLDAIEVHLPNAYKMLEGGIALNELAAKYPKAIDKVRRTFFNAALAAQAATRVEV